MSPDPLNLDHRPPSTTDSLEDLEICIPLCVQYKTTDQTFMSSCTQRLFNKFPTVGAILTEVLEWNGNGRYAEYLAQILQPLTEGRPLVVFNQRGNPQTAIGYPKPRLDSTRSPFYRPVFSRSPDLEVFSTPAGSGDRGFNGDHPGCTPGLALRSRPSFSLGPLIILKFERLRTGIQLQKRSNPCPVASQESLVLGVRHRVPKNLGIRTGLWTPVLRGPAPIRGPEGKKPLSAAFVLEVG